MPPLAPGPRGHPLFGSYRDLQRDPLGFFVRSSRDYGHVVRFSPFPGTWWHFISHPDHLEHVLQRHHANYPKGVFARLVSLAAGDGLISLDGQRWVQERKVLQPAFHGSRLAPMAADMARATGEILDAWQARAERPRQIDVGDEMMRLTLTTVGRTLCGLDIASTSEAFGEAFRGTLAYLDYRLVHPFALPLAVPTPRNRRYRSSLAQLDGIIERLIDARRRAGDDRGDVLSSLLAWRDGDGHGSDDIKGAPIDSRHIREEMKTMLTAGHETTGATLFWALYLIARHPEQERRLHAEIDALDGTPAAGDLARLPFARMVIEESLRLYPSVVWLGRVAAADDEIGGFAVHAGSRVIFSSYVTHRHPEFWERPDAFEPERFESARVAARPRSAYLPFGMGPRRCIGERFAMMETTLGLAQICRRFRLRLVRDEPVEPQLLATLRPPPGMMMRVDPR
jgi:cytochrome P450